MSNTSKGPASKGSKLMMQMAASPLQKHIIDKKIGEELLWLSPIAQNDYEEYQLSEDEVINFLGLNTGKADFKFWPSRQPQWDGIAVGKDTATLYLIEAKSHLKETITDCSATSDDSKKLISNTIKEIADQVYKVSDENIIEDHWMRNNYQLANRLVFLQKMKELSSKAQFYENVKLILLNFVNDPTWDEKERVTDVKDWKDHYNSIFDSMGISRDAVEKEGLVEIEYSAPYIY